LCVIWNKLSHALQVTAAWSRTTRGCIHVQLHPQHDSRRSRNAVHTREQSRVPCRECPTGSNREFPVGARCRGPCFAPLCALHWNLSIPTSSSKHQPHCSSAALSLYDRHLLRSYASGLRTWALNAHSVASQHRRLRLTMYTSMPENAHPLASPEGRNLMPPASPGPPAPPCCCCCCWAASCSTER
jgi:hypothetical protein